MRHSFWHSGVLIGEARLQKNPANPRQLFGELRPTAYGSEVLPRLTVLSAAAALKDEPTSHTAAPHKASAAKADEALIESSPAVQRMVDVGRALSEVELRDPGGVTLDFETIAFIDLAELSALVGRRPAVSPGARAAPTSRILVSATLAKRQDAVPADKARSS